MQREARSCGARRLRRVDARERVCHPARLPFEVRTLLDAELLVEDIAFDAARSLQHHAAPADRAGDAAAHDDFVRHDAAGDASSLADNDVGGVQVTLDLSVDVHLAFRDEIADDRQIFADVRCAGGDTRTWRWCRLAADR